LTHDQLDAYYNPLVFGVAEDMSNTLDGNLPGFNDKTFDSKQVEPKYNQFDMVNGQDGSPNPGAQNVFHTKRGEE